MRESQPDFGALLAHVSAAVDGDRGRTFAALLGMLGRLADESVDPDRTLAEAITCLEVTRSAAALDLDEASLRAMLDGRRSPS